MSLQNLKNQKGFTIVELLIVIVVIGILAAIVIVAYNGVTKKANTAAALGNAESIQKVAEAYNADYGTYPTFAQMGTYGSASTDTSRKPANLTLTAGITGAGNLAPDGTNGKTTISYTPLATATDGGCVGYWDFSTGSGALAFKYVGAAKTGSASAGVVSCT